MVYLPSGTIEITTSIYLDNNIKMIGGGIGATVLKITGNVAHGAVSLYNPAGQIHNVTISDFTIDCNNGTNGTQESATGIAEIGIFASNTTQFIIENIQVLDTGASALSISADQPHHDTSYGFISNVFVDGVWNESQQGLSLGGHMKHHLVFNDIIVRNALARAYDFSNMWDSTVTNIIAENCSGIKTTGLTYGNRNNTYSNIHIHADQDLAGFPIQYGYNCSYNNVFLYGGTNGIIVAGTSDYINLNNIHIENCSQVGFTVSGSHINVDNVFVRDASNGFSTDASDTSISNLHVSDTDSYSLIYGASNLTISDSTFKQSDVVNLYIGDSEWFSLDNCIIEENGATAGLYIYSISCHNFSITNCKIKANTGFGIRLTDVAHRDFIISGCHITGNSNDGIFLSGGYDINNFTITDNNLKHNANEGLDDDTVTSDKIIKDNIGYDYSNFNHFGDTANYIDVNETGVLTMYGDARVTRHVRVTAPSWKIGATAPVPGQVGTFPVYSFDQNTDDEAWYSIIIPWRIVAGTAIDVLVDWCYTGGDDAGTVCWNLSYLLIEPGEAVAGANTTIGFVTAGSHTSGALVRTTLATGITGAVAHDIIGLRLWRDTSEDSLATDAHMVQVHFEFTENKLGQPI